MMNPSDTLDPQIAQLLTKRPSQEQLMQYVSGEASPVLCEIIEAHMHRSPSVLMDIESLREFDREFDSALEQNHKQLESDPASARIGDISARDSKELALAAAERIDPPSKLVLEPAEGLGGILGLCCVASASVEAPVYATTFRLSFRGREQAQGVPNRIEVKWPTGDRLSRPFEFRDERWRSNIVLPVGWRTVSIWLKNGAVSFVADSE